MADVEARGWPNALHARGLPSRFIRAADRLSLVRVALVSVEERRVEVAQSFATAGPHRGLGAFEDWFSEAEEQLPLPFRGSLIIRVEDPVSGDCIWNDESDVVVGALREYRARVSIERVQRDLRGSERRVNALIRRHIRLLGPAVDMLDGANSFVWAVGRNPPRWPGRKQSTLERAAHSFGEGLAQGFERKPPSPPTHHRAAALRTHLLGWAAWAELAATGCGRREARLLQDAASRVVSLDDASGEDLVRLRDQILGRFEAELVRHPDSSTLRTAGARLSGDPEWQATPELLAGDPEERSTQVAPSGPGGARRRRKDPPRPVASLSERVLELAVDAAHPNTRTGMVNVVRQLRGGSGWEPLLASANSLLAGYWVAPAEDAALIWAATILVLERLEVEGFSIIKPEQGVPFDPALHEAVEVVGSVGREPYVVWKLLAFGLAEDEQVLVAARVAVTPAEEFASEE